MNECYDSWSFKGFDLNWEKPYFERLRGGEFDLHRKVGSNDIADLLPVDPFGMDLMSAITAIQAWPQGINEDFGFGHDNNVFDVSSEKETVGDGLFLGMDWAFNNTMGSQPPDCHLKLGAVWISNHGFDMYDVDPEPKDGGSDAYSKVNSDDVLDRLPVDPFGMDVMSTITAIKCWAQDFKEEIAFGCENNVFDESDSETTDDDFFLGTDWVFNGTMMLHPTEGNLKIGAVMISNHVVDIIGVEPEQEDVGFTSKSNITSNEVHCDKGRQLQVEGGEPHGALQYALYYLGMKDLLSVERVCRSLRDTIRSDPLLWKSIHIDQPLSEKITDEALVELVNRAQGGLQCLSLVHCIKITDHGLKQVLKSNRRLTKLYVPGCIRLTVDGILCSLRTLKSAGMLQIKKLRIGQVASVTKDQYEELNFLLSNHPHPRARKPRFYLVEQLYCDDDDDDGPIDIEACPRCLNFKPVYDCPAESCQQKHQSCRACTLCISRCGKCGRCTEDREHEETFFLDLLCFDCLKQFLSCEDGPEVDTTSSSSSSSGQAIFERQTYQFCLYGT